MIDMPEWVTRIAMAAAGAAGGTLTTGGVLIHKMANRTTALEARMTAAENAQKATQAEMASGLREIRREVANTSTAIAQAREDALKFFAADGDLKRLEDKLDSVQASVNRVAPVRRATRKRGDGA